jgi:hypothetical protein
MAAPVQAMPVTFQDEGGGVETIRRNPADPMKIKDSPPGSPARPEPIPADLSQLSHRLTGQHRTQAHSLDIWRILTCGHGF